MGVKSAVPFAGTPEQEKTLIEFIGKLKEQKGSLMPILQEAQNIYGYLPYEVQKIIALQTKVPLEKIYGIVTFYAQFSLTPKGKHHIAVCMGTACYVLGAGDILDRLKDRLKIDSGGCTEDGKFSLEACRCIGACGLAPIITVGEDVYGKLALNDVDKVLAKY